MIDPAVTLAATNWDAVGVSEHFVQFYDADEALMDAVAGYIGAALHAGDVGLVIATGPHLDGIEARLQATGLDLDLARESGWYYALDARETLARLVVGAMPDAARFADVIERLIMQAAASGRRVRAFGEMVALLALQDEHAAALHLEALWNDLQTRHAFALFCAYPTACLSGPALSGMLGDVCAQHTRVIPAESYTALPTVDDQLRAIVQWQQKAQSLEAALAAEHAARRDAEEALRLRDEFLSIASHELRTPLTTLSGHAQMALRLYRRYGSLEPERTAQALDTIHHQSRKLARLIGQLLDVTRLEGGKLALERIETDLTDLVGQAVAAAQAWSTEHTITLSAPIEIEALLDPMRIEQVITNLLHNAVKYSLDGRQIDVSLALVGMNSAELSVRDRGPGILPEKRERLFERFYQAHPNGGNEGGMGLGLYISRQIVEQHGGTIHAEFPADGGTRFVVRLPLG